MSGGDAVDGQRAFAWPDLLHLTNIYLKGILCRIILQNSYRLGLCSKLTYCQNRAIQMAEAAFFLN